MSVPPGLFAIGVGNLVPLVGVVLWGWDLPSILVMYWIETGVVGIVNVFKIRKSVAMGAPTGGGEDGPIERPITRATGPGSSLLAGLWLLAYGFFWLILGPLVFQIANGGFYAGASQTGWSGVSPGVIAWGTVSLVGGQLVAFVFEYVIGRRSLTVTPIELLRDPFLRIFVILATISVGGVGIALAGSPIGFLGAMVVAKTALELWFMRRAITHRSG